MLGIEKMFIAKADLGLLADSHRSPQSPAVSAVFKNYTTNKGLVTESSEASAPY
jgi:hypothetical protein